MDIMVMIALIFCEVIPSELQLEECHDQILHTL